MKEHKAEVKVVVPIRDLWKAMSSDLRHTIPKFLPGFVEEVELLEGDGGLGSLLLFKFGHGVPKMNYQKEKIVDLDESLHKFAIKVVEGGHLDHGFSSYTTAFNLQEVAESETLVEVKVLYETKGEDTRMPGESVKASLHYIKCLEAYLLNAPS